MSRRTLSTAAAVVVAVVVGWLIINPRDDESIERGTITRSSVVMLGDSLTAQGDWRARISDVDIVNEGHPGFTTANLRPIAERVARSRPRLVLLLTGTNDIRDGEPASTTILGLVAMLDEFAAQAPATEIILQTIPPRAETADAIVATNRRIVDLADSRGLEVLDLHDAFDDGFGGLRIEETTDGWHLSNAGYDRWVALLRPLIGTG